MVALTYICQNFTICANLHFLLIEDFFFVKPQNVITLFSAGRKYNKLPAEKEKYYRNYALIRREEGITIQSN